MGDYELCKCDVFVSAVPRYTFVDMASPAWRLQCLLRRVFKTIKDHKQISRFQVVKRRSTKSKTSRSKEKRKSSNFSSTQMTYLSTSQLVQNSESGYWIKTGSSETSLWKSKVFMGFLCIT